MKLAGREAARFCREPDARLCGALIHGSDAGQVAAARREMVTALMGDAGDDLGLTQLDAAAARRDAALIADGLRARGFFGGRPMVLIEGGTDGLAKPLAAAVDGLTPEDGFLIVTADTVAARSPLRKLFEGARTLMSLQLFADAMGPDEIASALRERGVTCEIDRAACEALAVIAGGTDHGSFRQLLDLIAVYALDRTAPLTAEEVEQLAPAGLDAETDALIATVAQGEPRRIGPLIRRLEASGTGAVTVLIGLQRHFRQLLTVATAPGGPDAGLQALRPPVWGPRRTAMAEQVRRWGAVRLEQANRALFEVDGKIRSSQRAPDMALLERCALRLAIMGRR